MSCYVCCSRGDSWVLLIVLYGWGENACEGGDSVVLEMVLYWYGIYALMLEIGVEVRYLAELRFQILDLSSQRLRSSLR